MTCVIIPDLPSGNDKEFGCGGRNGPVLCFDATKEKKNPYRLLSMGLSLKKIRAGRKPSSVPRLSGVMIIYLGLALLRDTSDLPGSLRRAVLTPLRGMLPYAVLLQAGFSKHSRLPGNLVGSYLTVSPLPLCGAVFFSVALSMGSPPVPFRDRLALRSSDFPPPDIRGAITSPALIV